VNLREDGPTARAPLHGVAMAIKCPKCKTSFEPFEVLDGRTQCSTCGYYVQVETEEELDATESLRKYQGDESAGPTEATPPPSAASGSTGSTGTRGSTATGPKGEKYVKIKPGQVLAGFRVEEILGAGAMAVVYKATQLSLNRHVALKILPERFAKNPAFIERFDKESDALAALNHPNIVGIIDRGHEGDTYFFVMEYIEGTSLRELMIGGKLAPEFFLRIMKQCCQGLEYAHSKNIIHRDIKPSNVMLNEQGIAKLADFGLAGMLAEERTGTGKKRRRIVMGTRGYMAPEQEVDISQTSPRSDLYAMGAVMYEVLAGKVPKDRPFPPPSELHEDVDPRLDHIIMKCLQVDPNERFQTAKELEEEIDKYLAVLTATGELCPNCKSENPVRERRCRKCGHDLSELFDVCPECRHENRLDVELCFKCGANLKQVREHHSVQIGKLQNQAREFMRRGQYAEAIQRLRPILNVPGKLFQYARDRSQEMIRDAELKKVEAARKVRAKAVQYIQAGKLEDGLERLKTIDPKDLDVTSDIASVEATMEECRRNLRTARELVKGYETEAAQKTIAVVERTWPECPGFEEARQEVQTLAQSESMIEYELKEADRLLEEANFIEAREAMQFAVTSMPEHPKVKAKLAAIERAESKTAIEQYLLEGKGCFEQKRFEEAAFHWKAAADLLPEDAPRKDALLKRIEDARERAKGPDAVKPSEAPVAPAEEAEGGPRPTIRVREAPRSRRPLVIAAIVVGVLVAGTAAFLIYRASRGEGPEPPTPPTPGRITYSAVQGDTLRKIADAYGITVAELRQANPDFSPPVQPGMKFTLPPNARKQPEPTPVPPEPPKPPPVAKGSEGPFNENFDSGEAENWQAVSGTWRATSTGRRVFRSLSPDTEAVAEHRLFERPDVGVAASVSIDAEEAGEKPRIAIQIRRDGERRIELRLRKGWKDAYQAQILALDGNRIITRGKVQPLDVQINQMIQLRIDAAGKRVGASVGNKELSPILNLPDAFQKTGKVALVAEHCRTSWDDIRLEGADAARIPEEPKVTETPPKPPKEPPKPRATRLSDLDAVGLQNLRITGEAWFARTDFRADGGYVKNVRGAPRIQNNALNSPGTGEMISVCEMSRPSEVSVVARCRIERADNSRDKRIGVIAHYENPQNYVVMGLQGIDTEHVRPFIAAVRNGKETVSELQSARLYVPTGDTVTFELVIKGNRALGRINHKSLVELTSLRGSAPARGNPGLYSKGFDCAWQRLEVRSASMPDLTVPDGAEVSGNKVVFEKARLDPATIRGLETEHGTLSVRFKLQKAAEFGVPQIALYGRMNKRGEELFLSLTLGRRKGQPSKVSLYGKVLISGALKGGRYTQDAGPAVWYGDTVTLKLQFQGNNVIGSVNNQAVVRAQDSRRAPLPEGAGAWGFRATYMQAEADEVTFSD
jgi:serine/threonine protein kinase